jgi:phosphohistidine phosphatase SixA
MEPFFFSLQRRAAMARQLLCGLACLQLLLGCPAAALADADADLWARLEAGGYVVLLQHASALPATQRSPGVPPEACGEYDELSDPGRREAGRLRDSLQRHHVSVGRVLTCHDCRCIQTAGIVFGRAEPWSIIDEAVSDGSSESAEKRAALREAVGRWSSGENLFLISHQSNYQHAFGVHPGATQLLVIEPLGDGGFRLLGRLNSD